VFLLSLDPDLIVMDCHFLSAGSPVAFPKKYDAEGKFVKHYVPALRKYPAKYIYEPWKAPLSVQREAGCIIGYCREATLSKRTNSHNYPKIIAESHPLCLLRE
jgi:deoxyribodipyrimidine photolyase